MSHAPARPRPEDRRRGDAEPAPVFHGAGPLPPWLRSEAFAEDLCEPATAAVLPIRALRHAAGPWMGLARLHLQSLGRLRPAR